MNRHQARTRVAETFPQAFNRAKFLEFTRNLLHRFDESKAAQWNATYVKDAFKPHVARFERLGTYTSPDDEKLDVLIVHLTNESKLERTRTAIRNFVADHLKTRNEKDAALVAFVSPTECQWRFSYVKMEYAAVETESGKVGVETRLTPARRFSYIVGEGESCHTAQSRFLVLLQDIEKPPTLAQIEDAFSVEAVTKEFFNQYATLFGKIDAALQKLAAKDKTIGDEFKKKQVSTEDFAKKLLGQIVFLYFLQKKGWLGVEKGRDWGTGPHDFLRRLASREYCTYDNFFNDILEPLFYDTLATDRGHEASCKRFKCRIPFLNGGLFEPVGDYDWRKTDVKLPNEFFTNTERDTKTGDMGTGILDVLDRYNFTVNEAEPLEKEVAIDPEMLGKVFENLIEENRRKGLGSFYTPREIVHYMCQESLINYLDDAINTDHDRFGGARSHQIILFATNDPAQSDLSMPARRELVSRADLEIFIHLGDQISHYEAVDARYLGREMPSKIKENARLIDEKLVDIAVCDPAVGSGAFPVGMMTEIVRARSALTPYFNDVHDRTPYHFKRHAIQKCLYGVDIDPGAVEIAKLRLWLSLVVDEEDVKQIKPLPNLDFKIVAGNSLYGFPYRSPRLQEIEKLKQDFFNEPDHDRKAELKRIIEVQIRDCLATAKRTLGHEVNFDFPIYFSEVFSHKEGFDVLIGNPPYGTELSQNDKVALAALYPEAKKKIFDVYNFFMARGLQLLAARSSFSFIVPPTWLNNKNSASLRRKFLANGLYRLSYVAEKVFESAVVDSVVFFARRGEPTTKIGCYTVEDCKSGWAERLTNTITTESLDSNAFLPRESKTQDAIVQKIKKNGSQNLGDVARIVFGIQTRKSADAPNYLHDRPVSPHCKRAINGKDMGRYYVVPPELFVEYGHWLWNKRDESIFKAPQKILIRQVGHHPICALDENQLYSLNTIFNVVVIDKRLSTKYVLALLNSSLVRYVWRHISPEIKDVFPRVKKEQLVEIPICIAEGEDQKKAIAFVDRIVVVKQQDAKADTSALERGIDQLVYALYGLTPEEIQIVESAVK